jgi:PPP family 3-phenylpropionic acid transporter
VLRFSALAATKQLLWLMLLQPLHAFSFAVVWLAFMELIRERAPKGLLGSAQGLFSTATAVGSTAGMLAFAPIYERAGGALTFASAAAVALLAVYAMKLPLGMATVTKAAE